MLKTTEHGCYLNLDVSFYREMSLTTNITSVNNNGRVLKRSDSDVARAWWFYSEPGKRLVQKDIFELKPQLKVLLNNLRSKYI